jgi:LysM repeat protein
MKRKEIVMVFFVLLVTALSLFVILQSSGNSSKNDGSNTNIESSTSSNSEANNSKNPTVIDKSNNTTNDDKTKTTTNEKGTTGNSSSDVDSDDEPKDDEDSSDTFGTDETYTLYEVKKGETLSSIVKSYDDVCPTSVLSKAILKANNLTKASEIKETMKIKIPDRYTTGNSYTVKSGDSLYTIAKSAFQSMDINKAINQLKSDNFMSNDNIRAGEKLFISHTLTSAASVASNNSTEESDSTSANTVPVSDKELVTYILKTGETLSSITKKYEKYCPPSIASKVILQVSGISASKDVKAGTEIKIPEKYLTTGEKYTVKSGDTLSAIASSHLSGMSVNAAIDKIKSDNFLSTYNIKLGEQLYITTLSLNSESESN